MASISSPTNSDDFVMLDTLHHHDLPLRQKHLDDEAEEEHGSLTTDDDELQHVSSPDSVISLSTITDSPSDVDDDTHVPSPTLPAEDSASFTDQVSPKLPQTRLVLSTLTEPSLPAEARAESSTQTSTLPLLSPRCHNHVSIDQQIMDLLIEHALTTRIEEEYGHGSANDKNLRQQMMARLRSLGADHSLVQEALSQTHGSKALFQGQRRTVAEHEAIYHNVFTDVERIALHFFIECHIRHFETACQFYCSYITGGRETQYQIMRQPGAKQAKSLALEIQMTVLGRLDADRAFKDFFDDLKRQTRWQIDPPSHSSTNDRKASYAIGSSSIAAESDVPSRLKQKMNAPSPTRYRSMELRRIFHATLTNLPNTNWSPDDPLNRGFITASKREQPEDELDHDFNLMSPPTKRPTLAARPSTRDGYSSRDAARILDERRARPSDSSSCLHKSEDPSRINDSANNQWTPHLPQLISQVKSEIDMAQSSPSNRHVSVPDEHLTPMTTSAVHPDYVRFLPDSRSNFDNASAEGLQNITMNVLEMNLQDRLMRVEFRDPIDRDPFDMPCHVSLLALDHLNRVSLAASQRLQRMERLGKKPVPNTSPSENPNPVLELEAALKPAGIIAIRFASLKFDNRDQPLSELEKMWIREYGIVNAQKMPAANTQRLVGGMIDDLDIYRHVCCHRLDATEYYFRMEALYLVKSMQVLIRHNVLHETSAEAPSVTGMNSTQTQSTQPKTLHHPPQASSQPSALQDYEHQLSILDQHRREKFVRPAGPEQQAPNQPQAQSVEPQASTEEPICRYPALPVYNPDTNAATNTSSMPQTDLDARPRFAFSDDEGISREYHRTTLLARSTDLPAFSCDYGSYLSGLLGQRTSTFAPAHPARDAPGTLVDHDEEILASQDIRGKRSDHLAEERTACHNVDSSQNASSVVQAQAAPPCLGSSEKLPIRSRPSEERPDFKGKKSGDIQSHVASNADERPSDYQLQLALLLKQNAARLALSTRQVAKSTESTAATHDKDDEEGLQTEAAKGTHQSRNSPVAFEGNGITWLAFEYTSAGVEMEYCIRTDVRTVGVGPRHPEGLLKFALAELNPCLRRDGTESKEHLLSTAVNHYLSTLKDLPPQLDPPEVSGLPVELPFGFPPVRTQSPFIIQTPDEIMADADSYDTDHDDSCESENDEEFYESRALPFFPIPFVTKQGSRHIIFEHSYPAGFTCTYYTIKADQRHNLLVGGIGEPERDQCLCPNTWQRTKFQELGHNDECRTGRALWAQNPILRGPEKRRLLNSAIEAFFTVRDRNGWHRAKRRACQGVVGECEVINAVVPEVDVDEGFVDFPGTGEYQGKTQSQCLHCNVILSEAGCQEQTMHFTACPGYRRVKGLR